MMDETELQTLNDGVEPEPVKEPKKVVWDNTKWFKCPECKVVNLLYIKDDPDCGSLERVCENCQRKIKITDSEKQWVEAVKAEIVEYTNRYNQKKANPPVGWDRNLDPDFIGRRERIDELVRFGRAKQIWVWDGVPMY